MTNERYIELELNQEAKLTSEEINDGYHWCVDWDGMLVGADMDAIDGCTCNIGGANG